MRFGGGYDGHSNLPSGVTGVSNGGISQTFVGLSSKFEWDVNDRFSVGVSAGIGLLNTKVDGSFRASGTQVALKAEAYTIFDLTDSVSIAPGLFYIVPVETVPGGATGGPNSDLKISPFGGSVLKDFIEF